MKVRLKLIWEPRDLWIGLYIKGPYRISVENGNSVEPEEVRLDLYLCIVPCLPLRITVWKEAK